MISVLLLCFLISSAASSPTEVIHLSDTSFEHDTQASSGKTTGIWAILLSSPSIGQRHDLAMQLWAKLAENEEKSDTEPIYATVDLDKNKAVAARFINLIPSLPSLLLLGHKGKGMYVYAIPEDDAEDHIVGIISGGYSQLTKQLVPPEVTGSQIEEILRKGGNSKADGENGELVFWSPEQLQRLYIAIFSLIIGTVWKVFIFFQKKSAAKPDQDQVTETVQAPKAKELGKKDSAKKDKQSKKAK